MKKYLRELKRAAERAGAHVATVEFTGVLILGWDNEWERRGDNSHLRYTAQPWIIPSS